MAPQDDQHFEVERGFPLQFGIVPAAVARDARIGHLAFRLWVVLATYADRGGNGARPSTATLSAAIGVKREALRRARQELRDRGLLDYEAGIGRRATRYVLLAPEASETRPLPRMGDLAPEASEASRARPDQTRDQIKDFPPGAPPVDLGTVNRKRVTPEEDTMGRAILDHLVLRLQPSRPFRWETHRTRIIGRIRAYSHLSLADHQQIIDRRCENPWWKGPGGPEVIYGNDIVFERALRQMEGGGVGAPGDVTAASLREMADQAEAHQAMRQAASEPGNEYFLQFLPDPARPARDGA